MKYSLIFGSALLASTASALALPKWFNMFKRQNIDPTVLQFALTASCSPAPTKHPANPSQLEHLENVFYKKALEMMPETAFLDAGYSADYYSNLKYIAHDEEQHVELLESALMAAGVTPNMACTYDFPFTDVKSFITLSSVLEGVGTSAYLGAAPLVSSKEYLTVAASILVTEALHTSMQRGAIGEVPAANPYGTPLSPNPVYTLAASFITACPASNAALPFMAFPGLAASNGSPGAPGMSYVFTAAAAIPAGSYLTVVSGLAVQSIKPSMIAGDMITASIPSMASGQSYFFITSQDTMGTLVDAAILFGPAILEVTPPAPVFDVGEA